MSHLPSVLALDFTLSMAKSSTSLQGRWLVPQVVPTIRRLPRVVWEWDFWQGFPMVYPEMGGQNLWAGIVRIWIKIKAPKDHIHSISSIFHQYVHQYVHITFNGAQLWPDPYHSFLKVCPALIHVHWDDQRCDPIILRWLPSEELQHRQWMTMVKWLMVSSKPGTQQD
jgi:hypothetical protein